MIARRPNIWLLTVAAVVACGFGFAQAVDQSPQAVEDSPVVERPIDDDERQHWSYRPLGQFAPPAVDDPNFAGHPVDRFVKAALEATGVEPLPPTGKATLARRLWFDLTGLPPTATELAAYLADEAPDAYERLVDRLLASPAYGERWAQHWLDLARFAETDGFEHDLVRPNAWRYRDWVIEALNRDLPFDQFVRLQVAGDALLPGDRDAAIATGFLLCGPDMPDINLQQERRHVVLNEMTSTVASVFLAMQFGCAQCHDHKYDPIRQHDFYRLRAFFESAEIFRDHPVPTSDELATRRAAEQARPADVQQRDERRRELESLARSRSREINPDVVPPLRVALARLSKEERAEHTRLVKQLRDEPALPPLSHGRVMRAGTPHEAHFYVRGDFRRPAQVLTCGFPRVLEDPASVDDVAATATEQPRIALARWLTLPDNPLTARVIVNRLWQWHFGRGLSEAASDFGVMGSSPTHPELLDWLAGRFIADGWSMKQMHRLLVTSRTYRLASSPYDAKWPAEQTESARVLWERSQAADPQNHLLWHRHRHRLEGEAIRDAMLLACDRLSTARGGPGIRPPLPDEVTATLLKNQWQVNGDDEDHRRRSIYLFVRRNLRYPMFDVFDRPDTMASCPERHRSTTATQSLTQFNSGFSLRCAQWLAGVVLHQGSLTDEAPIRAAYRRVFNREARDDEVALARTFLVEQSAALRDAERGIATMARPDPAPSDGDAYAQAALVDFCLALFNASEFLYVE